MMDEDRIETDYISQAIPDGDNYPVDYRFKGVGGSDVFLYAVANRDKARLTTIMLSHFLLHRLVFESIIVYKDQQQIPRLDLARLTNVAGTAVASLAAEKDLRRKIAKVVDGSIP